MKFLIFSLFIFLSHVLFCQWTDLNSGINGDLKAITFFQDDSTLYAAGETGIYYTEDGGQLWSKLYILGNPADSIILEYSQFKDIIANGAYMFAVGKDTVNNNGVVFRYSNLSGLWNMSLSVPGASINGIGVANTTVIAVGDNGFVRTTGTGSVWFSVSTVITQDLFDVAGNSSTAYIGGDGIILRSTGGFSTWSTVSNLTVKSIIVENIGMGHAVNETDGIWGQDWNWHIENQFAPIDPNCIEFKENYSTTHIAYIGTDNGIYGSIEDLNFYEFCETSAGFSINGMDFWGNTLGYAVGNDGLILKSLDVFSDMQPLIDYSMEGGCSDSVISFINNGPLSYDYTWNLNGQDFSMALDADSVISTPGLYEVTLIADNGNDVDSLTKFFYVTDLPDTAKNYSISDSVICHTGNSDIAIHLSDAITEYRLIKLPGHDTVDFQTGNGGDVLLNTGTLSDSTEFLINARSVNADCSIYFSDTIIIGVENTIASFHSSHINAALNKNFHYFNNSDHADFYEWDFGVSAVPSTSSQPAPDVLYTSTGLTTVTLIASTIHGCTDTVTQTSTMIYDATSVADNCWALNFAGFDSTLSYSHDHANAIEVSKSGNIIVCGSASFCDFHSKAGLSSYDYSAGFYVASYTSFGVLNWVVRGVDLTPQINNSDYTNYSLNGAALDISIDEQNNILVAGWANDDFLLHSNDGKDLLLDDLDYNDGAFVLKLDSNGAFLWKANIDNGSPYDICTDSLNNVYVSGHYTNGTTFEDASGLVYTGPSTISTYGAWFVLKLDNAGLLNWIARFGGNGTGISDVDVSPIGEVYVVGAGDNLILSSTAGSDLTVDIISGYLVKYSTNGEPIWVNDFDDAESVAVSGSGNVYVTLKTSCESSIDQTSFSSTGMPDQTNSFGRYALASYTSVGNLRWVTGIKYSPSSYGVQVTIDKAENIYTSGLIYANSPTNGFMMSAGQPFPSVQIPIESGNFFISKYDMDGKLILSTLQNGLISSPGFNPYLNGIVVDEYQNIFVTGSVWSNWSPYFYLAEDSLSTFEQDGFIARFSSSACLQPDQIEILSPSDWFCEGDSISVPFFLSAGTTINPGNIYTLELSGPGGNFTSPVTIGTLVSNASEDTIYGIIPSVPSLPQIYKVRVLASDPAITGNSVNITLKPASVLNPYSDTIVLCLGESVALQPAGPGYSYSWSPATFLNYTSVYTPVATPDTSITYISQILDYCGTASDTHHIIVNPSYAYGLSLIQICEGDSVLIFGSYQTEEDIYELTYPTINGCDSTYYQELQYYSSFLNYTIVTICNGDSLLIFGDYYSQNGLVKDEYMTSNGCDSTYSVQLVVIDLNVSYNSGVLSGNPSGYDYQWLNCDSAYAEINGANFLNFIPETNGSYALRINTGGCIDTSDCITITDVGLNENLSGEIKITPNPTNGAFQVIIPDPDQSVKITIYSSSGDIMDKQILYGQSTFDMEIRGADGTYFVFVETSGHVGYLQKIIKQ